MRKIEIELYEFNELSEAAKAKALSQFSGINTEYDWWFNVYEDAKSAKIKITS